MEEGKARSRARETSRRPQGLVRSVEDVCVVSPPRVLRQSWASDDRRSSGLLSVLCVVLTVYNVICYIIRTFSDPWL